MAVVMAIVVSSLHAEIMRPVQWTSDIKMTSQTEGYVEFNAAISNGWHMYALKLPEGGPRPTTFVFNEVDGVEFTDEITSSSAPIEKVDMIFHLQLGWWDRDVSFRRNFRLTGEGGCRIVGYVEFQGCNDQSCIPPTKEPFELTYGTVVPKADVAIGNENIDASVNGIGNVSKNQTDGWWEPVTYPEIGPDTIADVSESSWWYIFLWGFIGGLVALLTPCVWPMIPLTVSFFLKRSGIVERLLLTL